MHYPHRSLRRLLTAAPIVFLAAHAPAAGAQAAPHGTKQLQTADLKAWKSIRQSVLSNDGKWFAYVLAPNEGNAEVIVKSTAPDGKELKFPIGDASAAGGGGRGGPAAGGDAGANASLAISGDSKWVAFTVYPNATTAGAQNGRAGRGGRGGAAPGGAQNGAPAANRNKVELVNLATGAKQEFDAVRRFAFNGEKPTWIAMQSYPAQAEAPATGATGGNNAGATSRTAGSDLVLHNLANGEAVNIGNVAEFAFDEDGEYLAYTIDARDEIGNGVQLRDMRTDVVKAIDSDRALYRSLAWADTNQALTVLRGRVDSTARDTIYSVVAFTDIASAQPKKLVFDASQHSDFPSSMAIAPTRAPRFSEDLQTIFFGVREAKKPGTRTLAARGSSIVQAGAPGMGGTINQPRVNEAQEENPSLILWHYKDPRLQSQQIVQEQQDRSFNYLSEYRIADNKVIRLADDALRTVNVTPHDHFAVGTDTREYDQASSYNGRRYQDTYSVDLTTGARKLLLKKHLGNANIASPNGKNALYWGDDAQWHVMDLATGEQHVISKGVPTLFADTSDDHNNIVMPPDASLGWTKDGSAVLLSDGFDVWKVPVNGGTAVNLTVDGKKNQIRYQRILAFEQTRAGAPAGGRGGRGGRGGAGNAEGVDMSQPIYFATYGEWTKKSGVSKVEPNKPGAQRIVFDDANYNFQKAKDADVYVYTRQTAIDFPNYYVTDASLKPGRQLTDANPQQKDFAWTSGVKLINYTSAKGDKLQGALYLPANYEPGKKYPLLVTIYEKRSNLAHNYVSLNETSTPNRSLYTSRGYAVLDPDIVYRVNDPGMSAVWCVVPAVKAAIATGIVDSADVGLWGHSWGGYQTAFLVTQTNIFKAAIAGAPLTDMVSMYGSIYWNTGGADQAIFEASQGRFKGNYIDNYDAYIRNSPNFHAKNVKTPLIILANDKDGAVDFNQGITYFNTLRQLQKDVILLEYVGENHGLARPVNMKDYAMRQKDWFDHYLKGTPAPEWMTNGIPRIKMDEYWQQLKAQQAGTIVP
ncbi:MAG TPA: prolyl oligopeptidase family serine peptidase [Gemmatimonadaceae bacterium]|nr:prolyl oligopeptidase family serine peptidase [Gemmatimonadaceae bacterium]